jgi:carbamate kinase
MNTQSAMQSLFQQIAQIQHMERGKLCVLRQGPQGSYYNHQSWEDGKNVSRYVPQDQVPAMQQAIAGYEQFQNLTNQYAQMIIQRTRAELAAGSKKKTPRPKSSWPKTKRSKS